MKHSDAPEYQCHKKVRALKITTIRKENGKITFVPQNSLFVEFTVTAEYFLNHSPEEGGYWVQYEDGYESFSPADAFEKGYSVVQKGTCSRKGCCR